MPFFRRKVAALAAVAVSVLVGTGGCGWIGSDSDTSVPSTSVPQPNPGPGQVIEGRPWRRGRRRRPRVAAARWARFRSPSAAAVLGLDRPVADAVARSWARAGEHEHASIGAFVDLAADLRAHGAPAELVERCEVAAAQERDHTSRCFALASWYAGRLVRPGAIAGVRPAKQPPALTVLASESMRDGIVNEGVAALLAVEQAKRCIDPAAAQTLAVIARDEALHAELGWSILEWSISVGGHDVARCVRTTRASLDVPRLPSAPTELSSAVAEAHGRGVPAGLNAQVEALHDAVLGRLDALVPPCAADQALAQQAVRSTTTSPRAAPSRAS